MLFRHDSTKLGFNRERKSKLGNFRFQKVFEAFSYLSFRSGMVNFNEYQFNECLEKSIEIEIKDPGSLLASDLKSDIVEITCLVIEDGYENYAFVHKSVHEFFVASFLKNAGDEIMLKFLSAILDNFELVDKWRQILTVLSGLDSHTYNKHFNLKCFDRFIAADRKFNKTSVTRMIGHGSLIVLDKDSRVQELRLGVGYFELLGDYLNQRFRASLQEFFELERVTVADNLNICEIEIYSRAIGETGSPLEVAKFIEVAKLWKPLLDFLNRGFLALFLETLDAVVFDLEVIERRRSLISLHPSKLF